MERNLNERQKTAVFHKNGPMLVLAGPGSGKTTVLLCRILWLLEQGAARPSQILALTFSKAAAEEMQERFAEDSCRTGVLFSTFHSMFFRILRRHYGWDTSVVISEEERRGAVKKIVEQAGWDVPDTEEYVSIFFSQLSLMHSELQSVNVFQPQGMAPVEFRKLFHAYEAYKERQKKVDFDDMLTQCYHLLKTDEKTRLFWQNRFRYLLVDEFQDVNKAQFECLRILAEKHRNIFVVGDDDQSIYAFRGARPDFLLQFPQIYPEAEKVTLNINYRSTERVVALSGKVIAQNKVRFEKNMQATGTQGDKVTFFLTKDAAEEAVGVGEKIARLIEEGIPQEKIAVIYRTNIQGGAFARELYQRGIVYDLRDSGANVYDHWIAKDLLSYLLLAENEESDTFLRRILNKPKRYIGKELLAEAEKMPYTLFRSLFACPSLKQWQEEQLIALRSDLEQIRKRKPYDALKYIRKVIGYDTYLEEFAVYRRTGARMLWEIADEITELAKGCADGGAFRKQLEEMSLQMKEQSRLNGKRKKGVALMTMHSAKGLEFEAVFLPSLIEGIVPHEKGLCQIEEERRLFYVAMTRTTGKLYLSAMRKRYEKETKPSRFLMEMGLDVEKLFQKKENGYA